MHVHLCMIVSLRMLAANSSPINVILLTLLLILLLTIYMHVHSCMIFSLRMPAANSSPMNTMFPSIRTRTVREKKNRGKRKKRGKKGGGRAQKYAQYAMCTAGGWSEENSQFKKNTTAESGNVFVWMCCVCVLCVCVHVCMCVCVCVRAHARAHICVYACREIEYTHTHTHTSNRGGLVCLCQPHPCLHVLAVSPPHSDPRARTLPAISRAHKA
jgi:hypothetical protein